MTDLRDIVFQGFATRMNRDPLVERFVNNEVDGQTDQRVLDLTTQLSEMRRSYDAERKQLIAEGNAPESHVVSKLEEERDLMVDTIKARLAKYKRQ